MSIETAQTPSDIVGNWVRELRKQQGWTAADLANRCADAGAPLLTAPAILNIETGRPGADGRRRRDISVDELLTFAYVLGLSPASLLFPESGAVLVTPAHPVEDLDALRKWIRGSDPLPGMDVTRFRNDQYVEDVINPLVGLIASEALAHVTPMIDGLRAAIADTASRLERVERAQSTSVTEADSEGRREGE